MRKNALYILMFVLTVPFYVNASLITNSNLKLSDDDITKLKQLGFVDEQIKIFNEKMYKDNINLEGELISQETKYYKTTYYYPVGEYAINNYNNEYYDTLYYVEEISEDEYNGKRINVIKSNGSETITTDMKKMVTSLSYISNLKQYRATNYLHWKSLPATRSKDIIAMTNNNAVTEPVKDSENLILYVSRYDECSMAGYSEAIDEKYNANWEKNALGFAATFKFPKNISQTHHWSDLSGVPYDCRNAKYKKGAEGTYTTVKRVDGVDITLYYNLSKVKKASVNVYGAYKHAKTTFSGWPSVSLSATGISVSETVTIKYDKMNNTHASDPKPKW